MRNTRKNMRKKTRKTKRRKNKRNKDDYQTKKRID